jgi:hypothetical protein
MMGPWGPKHVGVMCFYIYCYESVITECNLLDKNKKLNYNARYGKYKLQYMNALRSSRKVPELLSFLADFRGR